VTTKTKLQIANGHYLDFDQTARLMHTVATAESGVRITMAYLEEETGLPLRQVRNHISIARAMGLFQEKSPVLSRFGEFVLQHDPFFENRGTLECVHYFGAGHAKNLVWFEMFDTLLANRHPMDYTAWLAFFRRKLAGRYSEKSLRDHLPKEVRFLIEAYTENRLNRLELLDYDEKKRLCRRRYLQPTPLVFCGLLYHFAGRQRNNLIQVRDLLQQPGSPVRIFFLGEELLNRVVETLHDRGYLRYEGTHDLNQLRLREDLSLDDFLRAHYLGKEPGEEP